jgi:ATP-dependent exoDNAse (exonuclease V) beta subunit
MKTEAGREGRELRRRVIDPEHSFIVQAPAGSGKTSLLTLRYLRLLGIVERPEEIVAITFTRKAATEMRHRIVTALASAAAGVQPAADAGDHDRERHGLAVAALERSRESGWGLESNPARLHVQTIDGLNHWLARRLPLAARIGLSAALVDDAGPLYAEAARRVVAELETESPVGDMIERLARALNHEPQLLARLIEGMLGTRELWLPKLLASTGAADLRSETDRLLASAIQAELARVSGSLSSAGLQPLFDLVREAAAAGDAAGPLAPLADLRALPPATVAAIPLWIALADLLLTGDPGGVVRKVVNKRQGFLAGSAGPSWGPLKARMTRLLGELAQQPDLAATLARVRQLPPDRLTESQWERIDALRAMLPHAVAQLLALFAERGRLDHAAVAAAARDALGDESAPTDLALALDYRIRHLLVDEYQDTSPAQERLLELLVSGWQPGDGRSLFCVGDPMQSIYAFREADVTLFLQAQRQGIGGVRLLPERLAQNFRSCSALVDWVNATFSRLLPADDDFERGAVRYSQASAVLADSAGSGVHVHPLIDSDGEAMGAEVAGIVARALAARADQAPASIAILVRGRASLPPLLSALRATAIEYRGVELESLTDRPAIRDLVALAKAMLHAGDRTAWLAVLRAPWCGLSLADLHALASLEVAAPVPALMADAGALQRLSPDGAARAALLADRLERAIAMRGGRTLGSWLKAAWLALAGPGTVDDVSDLANAELLFASLDTLESESGSWPEASAIDVAVAGIKASPLGNESARVQVMTIHRAKGLEFDVVIVPDLQRNVRGAERPLLYWTSVATAPGLRGIVLASRGVTDEGGAGADALERWMKRLGAERERFELGRVAYVAATRARRELHLVGSAGLDWSTGDAVLKLPPAESLLGFFWPVLRDAFELALSARTLPDPRRDDSARRRPRLTAPPLQRLPAEFVPPEPSTALRPPRLRITGEPEGSIRPDFDWAGIVAQAVGQVVHAELHRLARAGRPPRELPMRPGSWQRALREAGIDEQHLPSALVRVERAMMQVSRSELANRLLDPAAGEAASELALTAVFDGVVQSLRIDRSFVDDQGVRWIVDWKTSSHEGGNRDAFLDNELVRYAPQLSRYAQVLKRLDGRPQRIGLYFPLLDAWREL